MSGHVRDLLSAYLDGELSPPERGMVEAHLAACDECAARLEDFAAVDRAARDLPVAAPVGYFDTFPQRLRGRLRGRTAPARRLPVWTWATAAALLLAVLTPLTLRRAADLSAPVASVAERHLPSDEGDSQKPFGSNDMSREDRPTTAAQPRARRAAPALAPAPLEERSQTPTPSSAESAAFVEPPAPPPATARAASAPAPTSAPAEISDASRLEDAPARKAGRAEERPRDREATAARDADDGLAGEAAPAAPGLRGVSGGALGRREADAGDEFTSLRARSQPGGSERAEILRDLRDDWRSFAARNPSGARGDEARWQVIEIGFRAWRAAGETGDRAVLLHDARTYLERGDGAHAERVRALLAEAASSAP